MREDYASVVGEVKNYADQYLDLEVNGKWLVRALMELVEKDSLIQNNAKFMAIPGGLPAYKQEFPEMHVVYIYNLLLSVWHYICCTHGMTENGQETYFALADFAGESRPRKFDRSRIGFESHEDVMVSYDMEIVQDDMKIPEPAAAYVRKLAGKPDRFAETVIRYLHGKAGGAARALTVRYGNAVNAIRLKESWDVPTVT